MKLILILFILLGISCTNVANKPRKRKCDFLRTCECWKEPWKSIFSADCSNKHLKQIPRFPNILQELNLQANDITEIEPGVFFNNSFLEILDLSFNKIDRIQQQSFTGLENLRSLNLKNNNLSHGNYSFQSNAFGNLKALTNLNLKNNFIGPFQPDLSSLISLKKLSMDFISNGTVILEKSFASLRRMVGIDFSGLTGNCSVKLLTADTFQYLPQIRRLTLSGCKIHFILKGTFRKLKNITKLDISNNTCLKFQGLENVTNDLQFSAIKVLKVNKIHKVFDMNTVLKRSHVEHLKNTSVQRIECASNRIQQIEKGALRYIPLTLEYASLKDNKLSVGPYLGDLFVLSMKTLDISELFSFNKEDEHPEHCNSSPICNPNLNANTNKVMFDNYVIKTSSLGEIVPIPYRLKTLLYRSCGMKYEISAITLTNSQLEHVDMSKNVLYSWTGPINNATSLRHFDLSSNFCSNVSKNFFSPDFINLRKLYLQNNLLGLVLPGDVSGETLQHLHNITNINLSKNRIPSLPKKFFKSQCNLRTLDLSDNLMDNVDFVLHYMDSLSYLNLKNNRITFLDSYARNQLDSAAYQDRNFTVDLSGNPLECSCDSLDFTRWITTTNVRFRNLNKYECLLSNKKKISLKHRQEIYYNLRKACITYQPLIYGLFSAILLFLFILGTGLVYRYRWKLRYLYYMVKIRSHGRMNKLDNEDENAYMYGAFVSYADEDRMFVHTKLLEKLETESGIQLSLHKRNFLPGNDIATNITSAIHNSRKTIVIMSHSYLNSYWCMFEYNMARMESIYERNNENVLFLVFFEQTASRDLPLHVLELVQSQSYIEYPNDEYGDTVVWNQLKRALTT